MNLGVNRAKCVKAILSETKGDQRRKQVVLKFAHVEDPADTIMWYGFFGYEKGKDGKNQTQRTVEVLRTCGWEGDDLRKLETCDRNEVEITIKEDTFKDRTRLVVSFIKPIGSQAQYMPRELEEHEAEAFALEVMQQLRGGSSNSKPSTAQGQTTMKGGVPF